MMRCSTCRESAKACSNRDERPAAWHDHEYDEWWCQGCASGYGDELGAEAYPVEPRPDVLSP